MKNNFLVECEDDLESIIGKPIEVVKQKLRKSLDDSMMEFIRRSPLIFLSTVDDKGQVDISPKVIPRLCAR
ncbi:MAG: pyridoxamine 5'-phosphate oxidase family protein [Gammaproteobacteria bacterium]|nr:pyridoxamine 5'-phosphate oxidase family protein [Gammaproteobacteria bacterium]